MSGWRNIHVGIEGDSLRINGLAIWRQEWRPAGADSLELPHPSHRHQRHRFDVYDNNQVRFAAGELSNGVWGFYVAV